MNNSRLAKDVGAGLAARRKRAGLTQAQIAEKIAVEKETISRMESGKISLNLDRLQQFAQIFGCTVADLLRDPSVDAQAQAETIVALIRPLKPGEREAVVRFVADAARLFSCREKKEQD